MCSLWGCFGKRLRPGTPRLREALEAARGEYWGVKAAVPPQRSTHTGNQASSVLICFVVPLQQGVLCRTCTQRMDWKHGMKEQQAGMTSPKTRFGKTSCICHSSVVS